MIGHATKIFVLLITCWLSCRVFASELPSASRYENNYAAGKVALVNQQYKEAHRIFDQIIYEAETKAREQREPELINALGAKATAYDMCSEYKKADALKAQALSIAEKSYGKDSPFFALHLSEDANRLLRHSQFTEAERLFRRALIIREKLFQHRVQLAWDLAGLGKSLEGQGRYIEAEKIYVRCLKIYFPAAGELYPRLRNLGNCYLVQGRDREAAVFLDRATELEKQSKDVARAVEIGGTANRLCGQGKYQESEQLFKHALAIIGQYKEPLREHEALLKMFASMLDDSGRVDEARQIKLQAHEIETACDKVDQVETGLILQ